jgi:hypothetical protein
MPEINFDESKFLYHLQGILSYVSRMKNIEHTWYYDNFIEYDELKKVFDKLRTNDKEIIAAMNVLNKEINISKSKKSTRTKEEEEFYKHIIGVSSFVREFKKKDRFWTFNKEYEVNALLERMEVLKTEDADILFTMKILTKDYKDYLYAKKDRKIANEFQERLESLGIEKKKKKGFFSK